MIDINYLQLLNVQRANKWHKGNFKSWNVTDWSNAMAGEVGEACNIAKKIRRLQDGMQSINSSGYTDIMFVLKRRLGEEVADSIIYGVLLAAWADIDIEQVIIEVFNKKSEEYGFSERL